MRGIGSLLDEGGYSTSRQDHDLYRVVLALSLLLIAQPNGLWPAAMPAGLWTPPAGLLSLLSSPPPRTIAVLLQVGLVVALSCYATGFRTRAAAWTTGLLGIITAGFGFAFGKIDHGILLWISPVLLEELSRPADDRGRGFARQALAMVIAIAYFTAAFPKAVSGWLDPSSLAARGHLVENYIGRGRSFLLADHAIAITWTWLWELLDWMTILVESIGLVAWLRAKWFKVVLVVLLGFHASVLLFMNISFAGNVVVYGAFLPWGSVLPDRIQVRMLAFSRAGWPVAGGLTLVGGVPMFVDGDALIPFAARSLGLPSYATGAAILLVGLALALRAMLLASVQASTPPRPTVRRR